MIRLSQRVLCVDWDKRFLRIVLARLGRGRAALEQAHSVRIPADVKADEPESLGGFLARTIRKHGMKARQILVDVPRDRAVINRLAVAPTPERELPDVVRLMAMKELPFPLEEAEIDHSVLTRDANNRVTEVLLAAVLKKTLQRIVATCAAAGLKPARIGLRPYANLAALTHLTRGLAPRTMFIDVGAALTEIDIFAASRLVFSRAASVEIPDPHSTVPATEDSRILKASDLDVAAARTQHAIDDVLVEIARSLQAYRATDPGAAVESFVIAGGTGIEEQLRDRAAERFGVRADLFEPTALKLRKPELDRLRGFSAALGLGWGLTRGGQLEIDFLNPKRPLPRRQIQIARARTLGLAAACIATCIGGYAFWKYSEGRHELALLNKRIEALRDDVKKRVEVKNQIAAVEDWAKSPVWPEELLSVTQAAVEPGKRMLVQQMRLDGRTARIDLKPVLADNYDVPTQFVARLNEPGENGKSRYAANQGTLSEGKSGIEKFVWSVDVQVVLRELAQHIAEAGKREKDRRRAAREL